MRKKLYAVIFFLLVVTFEIVSGKEKNKTKLHRTNQKYKHAKEKSISERVKRSLDGEDEKPFWANRGKKKIESFNSNNKHYNDAENDQKVLKRNDNYEKEPFWGMRGRRESALVEDYSDNDNSEEPTYLCRNCYGTVRFDDNDKYYKDRRDESKTPFWGNRGRRSSDEIKESMNPSMENRGRLQDNEPFWGTRGRRKDEPFWGARGRREDEPFWGNRGRRDDEPFWGNRGRRDDEPFWGNRGRRDEEPFWGNRGRRQDSEPFWGTRGRRDEEPLLGDREQKKVDLKESIANAINRVENDIDHLSRLRRSESGSFWSNRGRESKLRNMFTGFGKTRLLHQPISRDFNMDLKSDPGTVHDSRIYAEEPHYIVLERSSRSSAESEDPFYISRGKKYYHLVKAARGRRGAIEEIVKSVRNDPYYIARGKKDIDTSQSKLNSSSEEDFLKAKELICSAADLITSQSHNGKVKREIDNDRDRRTILNKLAAQLQMDPYYVSRGKKSDGNPDGNMREFITEVASKCE